MVEVGDHYGATGDGHESGVYRVVGTGTGGGAEGGDGGETDRGVVLLRLTDGDGRRVHAGEVSAVSRETLERDFEPAADPDAGLRPVAGLRNALSGLYWSVRRLF